MPKVSIIIPVYNVEEYLEQCAESLTGQTLKDIEIIFVDDGSTDNSYEILKRYAEKDSRIKLIKQENKGQGVARNNALETVTGKYIGFADPDDWVSPEMFEALYNTAVKFDCDIVEESFCVNNEARNYVKKKKNKFRLPQNKIYNWKIRKGYLFGPNLAVWNKLYKTDFIKQNNIKFLERKRGEDIIFTVESRAFANKIVYIDRADYQYRIKKSTGSGSKKKISIIDTLKSDMKFYNLMKDKLAEDGIFEAVQDRYNDYVLQKLEEMYKTLKGNDKKIYNQELENLISEDLFKMYKKKIFISDLKNNIFSVYNTMRDNKKVKIIKVLGMELKLSYDRK